MAGDIPEETPRQRSTLVYTGGCGEGDAGLAQGGHAACEQEGGGLSSGSGDRGLSPSWSLVS